ncbi:MAG: DNA polymerase Y family protein [Fuerstiella sp.]|nr:DNA polymerase Y family protein [Fuerstiella sp.]MCP4785635.1 DNA polymerase Y family protein [Fuerstiella sp.]MCP4856560.1 DNA polymerase Y family protein [Fuerstiella sp.]
MVAVSNDAWYAGVRPGMPLAEARSMSTPLARDNRRQGQSAIPEIQFVEWQPSDDRSVLQEVAEHTRRFAPIVGLDEMPVPDCLHMDITGCGSLFGGESSLAEQVITRLAGRSYHCQVAISDSVATAWAFAHTEGHFLQHNDGRRRRGRGDRTRGRHVESPQWDLPIVIIPPGQAESWLRPLVIAAARIPIADAQVLRQLGILTIQQLLALPEEDLPSRLSSDAIRRLRQLRGGEDEIIEPIPEADPVQANWVSEFPVSDRRGICQVIEHLTEDIVEQLKRRHLGTVQLTCRLKQEDGGCIELVAEVIRPLQTASELFAVLRLRLESLSLRQAVMAISMHSAVVPMPMAHQKDLFSSNLHVDPAEELAAVVNRLSNRLGKEAVLTVHPADNPVPECAVELRPLMSSESVASTHTDNRLSDLVTSDAACVPGPEVVERPLRLLSAVERIGGADTNPLADGFVRHGQVCRVVDCAGPERIETQWWHESAIHRDYYRVRTSDQAVYWIYRDIVLGGWFLHGIFD